MSRETLADKGKYGEPEHWDGLTSLFIFLAEYLDERNLLKASERDWWKALNA